MFFLCVFAENVNCCFQSKERRKKDQKNVKNDTLKERIKKNLKARKNSIIY